MDIPVYSWKTNPINLQYQNLSSRSSRFLHEIIALEKSINSMWLTYLFSREQRRLHRSCSHKLGHSPLVGLSLVNLGCRVYNGFSVASLCPPSRFIVIFNAMSSAH